MGNTAKKELSWINTLKAGCILLVVLYHTVLPGFSDTVIHLTAGFLPAKLWVVFNNTLSPLRMPAFFFVSGLLATNGIMNRPWNIVLTSRVTNLFYLYFLWGIIQWLMINRVSGPLMGGYLSHNINAAWADSFGESIKLMILAMSSSWYLYALGLFFLFTKLLRHHALKLVMAAVLMNYAALTGLLPGWGAESLFQYFIFFLLGTFHSATIMQWSEWRQRNLVVWSVLIALSLLHIVLGMSKSLWLCILAIIISIRICCWLNERINMNAINWIGRNTLQIYVIHRIFIEFFALTAILFADRYHLFSSHFFSWVWAIFFPVVMVALSSACSLLSFGVLNRGIGRLLFIYPRLLRP